MLQYNMLDIRNILKDPIRKEDILEENTTNASLAEFPEQAQAALETLMVGEMFDALELVRRFTYVQRPAVNPEALLEEHNTRKPNIQFQFKDLQRKAKRENQQTKNPKNSKPLMPNRCKK